MEETKMGLHHVIILAIMVLGLAFLSTKSGLPLHTLMPAVTQPEAIRPQSKVIDAPSAVVEPTAPTEAIPTAPIER